MMSQDKIITILGPTATGKTDLAVHVADALGGEIVSADSRQVFRRMDIGTGKDLDEYTIDGRLIPYHMINIVEPGIEYNVFEYQQGAQKAIDDILGRNKPAILCGGSGMYIESVLKGYKLFPVPQNDPLRAELQTLSDEVLIEKLAAFKSLHNHTDTDERERLIRALEIEIYYHDHPELQEAARPRPSIIFGLCGDRNIVRQKITRRLKERLDNGLIEEVDALLQSGVNPAQLIRYGLEYKFITLYLQHIIDRKTLFTQLNTAIHQFSKRQMTWFRRMERSGFVIHWIDCALPMEEKVNMLITQLDEAQ